MERKIGKITVCPEMQSPAVTEPSHSCKHYSAEMLVWTRTVKNEHKGNEWKLNQQINRHVKEIDSI